MVTLRVATADTGRIIAAVEKGLAAIWRPGFNYKKAGVMLLDLVKADSVQRVLFDQPDSPQSQACMRAVDQLNRRSGRDTVVYAAAGMARLEHEAREPLVPLHDQLG